MVQAIRSREIERSGAIVPRPPVVFVRGEGSLLWDDTGKRYLDFSSQSLSIPPATLAVTLREWMERNPEKVLYGTDAYPQSETMGWEEALWMANRNGREALALALEAMERDHEVTHEQALKIAHQVLHDNAAGMYGL